MSIENSNILPTLGSIFVILVGFFVLLGWAFDTLLFKSVVFGFATMKPNTALCFLIFGIALWFSKNDLFRQNYSRRIMQGCAVLVLVIALLTLAEYVFNVNLGIDRILFSQQISAEGDIYPGRMSPVTAFNFFILSAALLFRNVKIGKNFYPAQWLVLTVALTSLIVIIGYAYNVQALQQAAHFASVAIHSVISFFIISLCFLFIDGDRGITAVFFRKSPGGLLTRRLVPAALIVPMVFGWLQLKGEYAGYYNTEFGVALFATSNIIVFTFLIWRSAFWLDQTDAVRQTVQDNLSTSLKNLADMKFALDESSIVAFTDQTGKINFVNDKFCEISGYSREELVGQDHRIINSGFHPKEFIRELWTTIAGGKVWRGELQNRAKDGSIYWVDTTIVPFLNEQGKPFQYVAIRNDITSRKQAETALVNMASIVESSADAIISKEFDGTILSWNKAAERIFGYTAEEAVGQNITILFPPELLDEEQEIVDKIKRGEQLEHYETLRRRKDGSDVEISLTVSPIKNENGEIVGISKIAREISEQKRAAEALRESEGKMRLFVEYAPAAVAMFDREMRYLAVSRRWMEDYKLTENLIGRNHYEVFPDISEKWKELHRKCLAGTVEKLDEDNFIRADGSVSRLKWEILPWFNAADDIGGIIIFSEDITDRKRAEKIISENEKQLRRVLDNLFIFVGLSTPDGTLVEVNRAPLEAAGVNVEDVLGKKTWETVWVSHSTQVQRQMREDFERAAQGEIIRHDLELQISGGVITIDYMLAPVRDDEGNITHLISSGVDISERKRAEETLRESEKRYRTLFESIDQGFCLIEVLFDENKKANDYRFLEINPAFEQLTGISAEAALRETSIRSVVPDLEEKWFEIYGKVALTGESIRFEENSEALNRWFDIYAFSVGEPENCRVAVIFTNITERKLAEANLREREAHFHATDRRLADIVYGMSEACFALDADWCFTFVNNQGETLLRHCREELLGKSIWKVFHKLVGTPIEESYRRTMTERIPVAFEAFSPIADRWLDIRVFPSGEGVAVFLLDIHERKAAESERQKFVSLAENSIEFIGICDLEGIPLFINEAGRKLVGLKNLEETVKTPIVGFFFPEDREFITNEFLPKVKELGHAETEIRFRNFKTGQAIWMIYNVFLVKDENDLPVGFATVSSNITERKQYEQAFIRLNQSLEQKVSERTAELNSVNRELEAFSYSVSHDLRAPLRAMDGFSLALLEDYAANLDATGQNYLNRVRSASQQMARLIDDMLLLSRVTRSELIKQDVNLSEVARSIAERLQETEPRTNVVFEIEEDVRAFGDSRLLRIALENLLGNAYKFTSKRDGAKISFGQIQNGDETEYFVKDNGAGFDMTYAGKLFGAFQRLHNSTEFEGTGIGLATVQRVVRRHGGSVRAEAAVGKGASFYFTV
ncbi:MAG TPA: PAS domain S-box protein [Pyrinomonadaceae bacterium]|jgi:PAS domain S-box-containing protein|nr:PAS domain S-box protein [Pyrinomonadaceae bacterium]